MLRIAGGILIAVVVLLVLKVVIIGIFAAIFGVGGDDG